MNEVGEVEAKLEETQERIEYINFGFPDTTVLPLAGFDLAEFSPLDGRVIKIVIDSPSEFMGIICRINEIQILPLDGELTIRTSIEYPINRKVTGKDRLVVALNNHDPLNPHTPSVVWQVKGVDV